MKISHGEQNNGDLISVYGHLEERSAEAGDTVSAGQQVGTVGKSGAATGYILHFETYEQVSKAVDGQSDGIKAYHDPLLYLPETQRLVSAM